MSPTVETPPLSVRLRTLLVAHASAATLTCTFKPGGQFGGVGIRSHLYCAHCRQGLIWHELAAGLQLIATAEAIIQGVGLPARAEEETDDVG